MPRLLFHCMFRCCIGRHVVFGHRSSVGHYLPVSVEWVLSGSVDVVSLCLPLSSDAGVSLLVWLCIFGMALCFRYGCVFLVFLSLASPFGSAGPTREWYLALGRCSGECSRQWWQPWPWGWPLSGSGSVCRPLYCCCVAFWCWRGGLGRGWAQGLGMAGVWAAGSCWRRCLYARS